MKKLSLVLLITTISAITLADHGALDSNVNPGRPSTVDDAFVSPVRKFPLYHCHTDNKSKEKYLLTIFQSNGKTTLSLSRDPKRENDPQEFPVSRLANTNPEQKQVYATELQNNTTEKVSLSINNFAPVNEINASLTVSKKTQIKIRRGRRKFQWIKGWEDTLQIGLICQRVNLMK